MAKRWLIAVLVAGLFGGKAFADCAPSPDTPASVIEYFQRFNKPLPGQFCANQDAGPQASVEPPQEARQTEVSEPESAENRHVSGDVAHGEQAKTALEQSKPQPIAPQETPSPHAITPDEAPPKIAANPTVPTPQIEATQTPKPQPESSQDLGRQQEFGQEPGEELRVASEAIIRDGPSASAEVIGYAHADAILRVKSREAGWVQFVDPAAKKTGWISMAYLRPADDASADIPSVERTRPEQPPRIAKLKPPKQPSPKVRQLPPSYAELPADQEFGPQRQSGLLGLFWNRRVSADPSPYR